MPASAALASRGEMASATSRTRVPAGTARLDPSGSVTFTWLMGVDIVRGAHLRSLELWELRWATFAWLANRSARLPLASVREVGRHGWIRTTDLLRVKQAL